MENRPPYHQQQILRRIPAWAQQLHPRHAEHLLDSARNEHIQENGTPVRWFADATARQQALLREAIKARTAQNKALAKALKRLQPLPQFCEPLLQAELAIDVPVTQARYCFQPYKTSLDGQREGVPGLEQYGLNAGIQEPEWQIEAVGEPESRSLLEAAMHNFEGVTDAGPLSTLQVSSTDSTLLPGLTMARFVTSCRQLDLGKRYQTHLDSLFNGTDKAKVQKAWTQAQRAMIVVRAIIAEIRGKLSNDGYQALRQFCAEGITPHYGKVPVTVRTLTVLGIPLHGPLLLGPAGKDSKTVAYLPFDHGSGVQEFNSLKDLQNYLASQLLDEQYRQRLVGHAAHDDQPKLANALFDQLYEEDRDNHGLGGLPPLESLQSGAGSAERIIRPKASPNLGIRALTVDDPHWTTLYNAHVKFLKHNAKAIAVPTADIQAKVRQQRLAFWEDAGLNVLNVAAMFVPGLDAVMLLVFAAQLLDNIYLAYEAWSEGDYAEALAQLKSLVATLGSVVVLGAAATAIKPSAFVEWLERVVHDDQEVLWHPQLQAYHSELVLPEDLKPDAEGIYAFAGRHYTRLDGKVCEVEKNAKGDWALVHGQDRSTYRPVLRGNRKGAWRLDHEQVMGWDKARLLQRMGPVTEGQSAADLAAAFDSTGLQQGVLETVLADGQPVPPSLDDALLRLAKDTEVDDIIIRTRHGLPLAAYKGFAISTLAELPGWPENVVLKAYESSEAWGSFTRYGRDQAGDKVIEVTRSDLDRGELAPIVLQNLDETTITGLLPETTAPDQRRQALQDLLADRLASKRQSMFESLYKGQRPPLSKTAEALGRQFPNVPDAALEEIVSAATQAERTRLLGGRVPLRIAEEARRMQANVRLGRAIIGLYRPSLANADTALLRDSLLALHPGQSDQQLYQAAIADRAQASRMLGQQPPRKGFRSPMRLSDGRLGYPLSPGIFATREERELHALFPGMNGQQRRRLLATLRERGNVTAQLQAYRTELDTLHEGLDDWAAQRPQAYQRHANTLASTLIRAWHHLEGDTLVLANLELDSLPTLTARLDHIRTLQLDNLTLPQIPADYLQSFPAISNLRVSNSPDLNIASLFETLRHAPQLRELNIESSGLARLPAPAHDVLPLLSELRFVGLRRNQLTLTDADLQLLTGRTRLLALDLSHNRITLDATMAQRFTALNELRVLNLNDNPLRISPDLSNLRGLATLRLENCELTRWPVGLTGLMGRPVRPFAGGIGSVHLYTLRQLDLSRNRITEIPGLDNLTSRPFVQALRHPTSNEQWRLSYNPLGLETRVHLRAAGVVLDRPAELLVPEPAPRPQGWLHPADTKQQQLWDSLFAEDANRSLRDVVEQAGLSRSAQTNGPALTRQIWDLLQSAAADSELRTRLNEVAQTFPVSCGDAGADALGTLQIEARVFQISAGQSRVTPEMFTYFRSLYRRDQVNDLAQAIYNARLSRRDGLLAEREWRRLPAEQRGERPSVGPLHRLDDIDDQLLLENRGLDLIEIRLAIRTNLAQGANFPEPQMEMLYRGTARIDRRTQSGVLQEVLTRDRDQAARRLWVSRHPSWRRVLRAQFRERFETLRSRWDVGVDYLDWCLDGSAMEGTLQPPVIQALTAALGESPLNDGLPRRQTINSAQYEAGMNRMAQGLESDEDTLFLELTEPQDNAD